MGSACVKEDSKNFHDELQKNKNKPGGEPAKPGVAPVSAPNRRFQKRAEQKNIESGIDGDIDNNGLK